MTQAKHDLCGISLEMFSIGPRLQDNWVQQISWSNIFLRISSFEHFQFFAWNCLLMFSGHWLRNTHYQKEDVHQYLKNIHILQLNCSIIVCPFKMDWCYYYISDDVIDFLLLLVLSFLSSAGLLRLDEKLMKPQCLVKAERLNFPPF